MTIFGTCCEPIPIVWHVWQCPATMGHTLLEKETVPLSPESVASWAFRSLFPDVSRARTTMKLGTLVGRFGTVACRRPTGVVTAGEPKLKHPDIVETKTS